VIQYSRSKGNKWVDKEAKKAPGGNSSQVHKFPKFLMGMRLPLSMSEFKQDNDKGLKERWWGRWRELPRHQAHTD